MIWRAVLCGVLLWVADAVAWSLEASRIRYLLLNTVRVPGQSVQLDVNFVANYADRASLLSPYEWASNSRNLSELAPNVYGLALARSVHMDGWALLVLCGAEGAVRNVIRVPSMWIMDGGPFALSVDNSGRVIVCRRPQ